MICIQFYLVEEKKDFGSFSYGNIEYLLDHITTTEIDAGILIEELSKYCDEGKSKEVIKTKNKEDLTGIKVIEGIKLLSKLGLGLLIIDTQEDLSWFLS